MNRQVELTPGNRVPAIGQGTWYMGEKADQRKQEVYALQLGIDLGMTVIDTAEMYAEGGAERVVGEAVQGRRDQVFIVSKVYPHHAAGSQMQRACDQSLKRLGTDCIDLYLLHWRGDIPLEETVTAMEGLRQSGKIRAWGVSNLDTADMEELWSLPGGDQCAANQVLYHAASRGIEVDLLPWARQHHVPTMAYCPLAQGGQLRRELLTHPVIGRIAKERGATPAQIALAWVIREDDILAIPKAVQPQHVKDNAAAADIRLTARELADMDGVFPAPASKVPLDIV
ncbi:aldo/keto reductase [Paenibacillus physcomitrellae]|uniref:Oxidoreductase n=1 Tax=Paenibacillus physcomitrellae TaxID=1619311 RepID=A0ABQ1FRB3_9BACL|nr:aldo/keto reductase [Paenibacillus physcomitrellae]GGA27189.1 oxidoreductase [Paenibacillus physcomitrellae]